MSTARLVLERLLHRAERARLRGVEANASLPMGRVSGYAGLRSLAELDAFHADILLAEREGAITVQREHRSGDGSRLVRLSVADVQVLAAYLGVTLLEQHVAEAVARLSVWVSRFPVIADVLDEWRQGRKIRGSGAEAAAELADAATAVAARADDAGHERILRRESVHLFGDSKRLEKLTLWLELLVTGELAASGLAKEEVWAAVGLRREPQPMLLAGSGSVELVDATLPLVRPYLGLPVESVRAVVTSACCVLSIENLASFHDAARAPGADAVLLLYTGGMPSPAWRAAYASILARLPSALPIYHWGDIDEGGFRIAAVLARTCAETGHALQPWRMSPNDLPDDVVHASHESSTTTLAAMCRWAAVAGWEDLAVALRNRPIRLEQEALDPLLPRH